MKQLSDELIDIFQTHRPTTNTWLQTVYGVGHKIETSSGAIGYYTGQHGFELTTNNGIVAPFYDVARGAQTFSVSDTNGTAAYIVMAGNASYDVSSDDVATIRYPLLLTLVGDADKIEDYAAAMAFILARVKSVSGVNLNHNKNENIQQSAKSNRKSRNTATGVANINFTMTVLQGRDCLVIDNC
jgi:hypothetical protein